MGHAGISSDFLKFYRSVCGLQVQAIEELPWLLFNSRISNLGREVLFRGPDEICNLLHAPWQEFGGELCGERTFDSQLAVSTGKRSGD